MKSLLLAVLAVIISCSGPSEPPHEINGSDPFSPRWTSDIPIANGNVQDFQHDNKIYESKHFLTYSDAADDVSRIEYAEYAERSFTELATLFSIQIYNLSGIDFHKPETKIQIILDRNDARNQLSFRYGFLLYSLDSPYCFATEDNFFNSVKHELTHVFQAYMTGTATPYVFGWFREGLAECAADGGFFPRVTKKEHFQELKELLDRYNVQPLNTQWSSLPGLPGDVRSALYSMSALAVRYLLDENGGGKSFTDVRDLFFSNRDNAASFEEAFQTYMGMNINIYEDTFYQIMETYFE